MHGGKMTQPMSIKWTPPSCDEAVDLIMQRIADFLNSNQDFTLDEGVEMHFTHQSLPGTVGVGPFGSIHT